MGASMTLHYPKSDRKFFCGRTYTSHDAANSIANVSCRSCRNNLVIAYTVADASIELPFDKIKKDSALSRAQHTILLMLVVALRSPDVRLYRTDYKEWRDYGRSGVRRWYLYTSYGVAEISPATMRELVVNKYIAENDNRDGEWKGMRGWSVTARATEYTAV